MMDMTAVAVLAGIGIAVFLIVRFWLKMDEGREERRRRSMQLHAWCNNNGLPSLALICSNYAVGDYSGLRHSIKQLQDLLADPDESLNAVQKFLRIQLDKQLATAEGREELIKHIEKRLNVSINRQAITQAPAPLDSAK